MYKQKKNGYSIIEMVIYLAIFTSLSILVVKSFVIVLSSSNYARTNRNLMESGSNAMERIVREIRKGKAVNVGSSTFGTSPGVLQLDNLNITGQPDSVIRFTVLSGALNIYENGVLIGNLLGQNVSVNSLIFRRIVTTNSEAIKIELIIQTTYGTTTRLESFYTTVMSRGGY